MHEDASMAVKVLLLPPPWSVCLSFWQTYGSKSGLIRKSEFDSRITVG